MRERAVRTVTESRPNYPTEWAAMKAVAAELGIKTPETVRTWVRKAEVDAGRRPGTTPAEAAELELSGRLDHAGGTHVLTGPRMRLEPLTTEHAPGLLTAADQEVFAHLPYPRPASISDMRAWIEGAVSGTQRRPYAIITRQGIAGTSSYWYPDPVRNQIEIGSTWIGRPWWGSGTNTEAKRLMLTYAFDVLGYAKVVFRTDTANLRSQRALEKLGAHRDGLVQRDWPRPDGTWRDSVYYSVIRTEWPAGSADVSSQGRAQ